MSTRWEHGSDFHLEQRTGELDAPWTEHPHTLWGSGRDAMRGLLAWGREHHGWQRVWVPSFYCQKVVAALARELPVVSYVDSPEHPLRARLDADAHDVVIAVNLHGTRTSSGIVTRGTVVEDHTHDPFGTWARESDAPWAVASLRKTLPLPDGGVLWSPRGEHGPAVRPLTDVHARAAADRLAGMVLKHDHLEGRDIDKSAFRACLVAGERAMASGVLSGISAFSAARLPTLPTAEWHAQRQQNIAAFADAFGSPSRVRLLPSSFAATLVFDRPEHAAWVRESLIAARVYPAVLWSLASPVVDVPAEHRELSRRILTLHCDHRYTTADMHRVADTVRHFIGSAERVG
jgi:hypothetical protein